MNINPKRNLFSFSTLILFLVLTVLTMSACDEYDINASEDLSSYPESVQDGTVSAEYYERIVKFYERSDQHKNNLNDILLLLKDRAEIIKEENFNKVYTGSLKSYGYFLDECLEAIPITSADKEIDEVFRSMINSYQGSVSTLQLFELAYDEKFLSLSTESLADAEELLRELNEKVSELDIK